MHRNKLKAIYEKTAGRCWYCGKSMHPFSDWQVEHQHPRSAGGSNDTANLVAACRECNAAKGKRNVEEYRHSLRLKLEHAITAAYEMSEEIEGRVAWDSPPEAKGTFVPPEWLCHVSGLLHDAGVSVITSPLLFYGERVYGDPATPIQETETVV